MRLASHKKRDTQFTKSAMQRIFTGYAASFYGLCSDFLRAMQRVSAIYPPIKKGKACTPKLADT